MVLKRILVTTLGALGLGALVVGTASGQSAGSGNIPAPDVFDDQITCTQLLPTVEGFNLPSTVPMGGMTSPLDDLIGMGTNRLVAGDTVFDALTDGAAKLEGLGYVIPAGNMNCGGGDMGPMLGTMNIDTTDDGDFLDDGDTLAWGSVPKDVADGYTDLLGKFKAVYGDPGGTTGGTKRALDAAQKALDEELKKAEPSQTLVSTLTTTRDNAETAHNKAMAAFNAASGGPIYQAGVAEWMAKAAVTKSVMDYSTQVGKTNTALTNLNARAYTEWDQTAGTAGRSKYVPLGNSELITTVVTGIATGMAEPAAYSVLQGYANHDGSQVGTHGMAGTGSGDGTPGNAAPMGSVTTNSNFDVAGRLIIPMEPNTDTTTDPIDIRTAVSTTNTVADIRTTVMNVRTAEQVLKKARDENLNPLLQAVYDEAYRRAKLERDYYDQLWNNVLADTVDQRTADQRRAPTTDAPNELYMADPLTISSLNSKYITESNKRLTAENDLRSKVAAREMATAEVVKQFTGGQSFYAQLVARREALKAAADKAVANATTPSEAQTKAAADAATALMAAQTAKDKVDDFYDDADDPSAALVDMLLKNGGDDGQALVDAISSNYDTANDAKTRADEVAEQITGLTGDEGAVAMNTERSRQNAEDIEGLDGRVSANEAEIGMDENGMSRIDHNEARSMANATNIATNADNIMTNADNIMTNAGNIATNADNIATNAMGIATNSDGIMTNAGNIATNTANIGMNTDAITALGNRVGSNESAIMRNSGMIGELSESLETVRAGVAASMALAGMPAINGRGISIGVGSFDGESAFAVGFMIQGEMASFKVGVTSAGGETGASAGVGFQF